MKGLKKNIKRTTRLDFFDWCNLILFISGIILLIEIKYFYNISVDNLATCIVLWFTGIAILQYTKETYHLKQIEQKNLKFQKAPFVIIAFEMPDKFILKNVGKGVACNVQWEIIGKNISCPQKTIIAPDERFTRIPDVEYTRLLPSRQTFNPYEIVIMYENLDGEKYFTRLKSNKKIDDYIILEYRKI